LGFFDFAKHIPKRISNFQEIKFRGQGSFGEGVSFFLIEKILRIKEPWVSLILPNTFLKESAVFMK
jgi:hypothetical protein